MTGASPITHVFSGQIAANAPAATPPDNVQILSVNNAFWNNTSSTQNSIPAGQIKLQVTTTVPPVVGQTLKLSNLTFTEWDSTAPTNPTKVILILLVLVLMMVKYYLDSLKPQAMLLLV